jgi:hypothetical protein
MRVVQFQTVISGDMRCSLRYDLAFLIVCFVLITLSFQNVQQSRTFGASFKFPEGAGAPGGGTGTAPGSGNAAFADDTQDDDLYA